MASRAASCFARKKRRFGEVGNVRECHFLSQKQHENAILVKFKKNTPSWITGGPRRKICNNRASRDHKPGFPEAPHMGFCRFAKANTSATEPCGTIFLRQRKRKRRQSLKRKLGRHQTTLLPKTCHSHSALDAGLVPKVCRKRF